MTVLGMGRAGTVTTVGDESCLGALAVAGGGDWGGGWGGDADELGDGVEGEVSEPDIAGGIDGKAARVAKAGGPVAGSGRDRGTGVCEGREGVAVAVGDPDAVAAVDGDLRGAVESASGEASGG